MSSTHVSDIWSMGDSVILPGILAAVVAVLGAHYVLRRRNHDPHPLPPSPTTWPLIGNLLSMPTENEHVGFMQLSEQLNSDIISLRMFGTTIVVLNSSEDAVNLLEKKSGVYSDRVCPVMLREPSLFYWPGFITLLGYNDRWRKSRRLMHTYLHKKAAEDFHSAQQLQARLLLQRTAAATLVHSVYGYNLQSSDDPFVLGLKEAMDNGLHAALPSSDLLSSARFDTLIAHIYTGFLVNLFPALVHVPGWIPGTRWKRTALEWRAQKDRAVDTTYNWSKDQIENGTGEPSIIASLLEHAEQLGLGAHEVDDYVKNIAVSLLAAGTDTTTNTLLVFVLAMLLFPETQLKAQEEISVVIGSNRLPTLDDWSSLPYLEQLLQEVLQWCPILPGGFPHACYQDDVYKGYLIPKGAMVIPNVWAFCWNPEVYPDPAKFDPDRFLDPEVPLAPAFGYGRRSCPGIHFADSSLFIAITSMLATFTISPAKDGSGHEIMPVLSEGSGHVVYRPQYFKLELKPRSQAHIDLIRAVV
ncbi:cytochrome P450 family protein [Ceratobasidium sp. AG-Ba]|nr:cytochrome P450 family protein [Ceratobasidium sp. AG-Ba]